MESQEWSIEWMIHIHSTCLFLWNIFKSERIPKGWPIQRYLLIWNAHSHRQHKCFVSQLISLLFLSLKKRGYWLKRKYTRESPWAENWADKLPHFPGSFSLIVAPLDCILGNAEKEIFVSGEPTSTCSDSTKKLPFPECPTNQPGYPVSRKYTACLGRGYFWGSGTVNPCLCESDSMWGPSGSVPALRHSQRDTVLSVKAPGKFGLHLSKNINGTLFYSSEWVSKSSFFQSPQPLQNLSKSFTLKFSPDILLLNLQATWS